MRLHKKILTLLLVVVYSFLSINPSRVDATLSGFSAGRIMDDAVMANKNSMSEAQIQAFLKSKNSCNDSNLSRLSGYNANEGWINGSNGKIFYYNLRNGKFVCMADENFNGESAARIIWQAAQDYSINPQVLVVLLQKEQGLVTDTWPNKNYQYAAATGYDCPDNGNGCNNANAGFKTQVRKAANLFRAVLDGGWSNYPVGVNYIQYSPIASCGGSNVNIQNRATSSLYRYTPYQPNPGALAAGWGTATCGAYGNRNFYNYFTDWFGSAFAFTHAGRDYSGVFDATFYANTYSDIRLAYGDNQISAFQHFVAHGMSEGRQGSTSFNVTSYRNRYPDLRVAFGTDLPSYYHHYVIDGKREGRIATGSIALTPITSYGGVNYSSVYDFNTYINNNSDLKKLFSNDDVGAIMHFIRYGMSEGRTANTAFNVSSYRATYYDLRRAFGSNLKDYYMHYINNGKSEGRTATGTYLGGITSLNNIDYSAVYSFNTYSSSHPDIKKVFGLDDINALSHFVTHGMQEGRQASDKFNVQSYRARYADLRSAFGNNLVDYYMHYIKHGKTEGRIAN